MQYHNDEGVSDRLPGIQSACLWNGSVRILHLCCEHVDVKFVGKYATCEISPKIYLFLIVTPDEIRNDLCNGPVFDLALKQI